MTPTGQPAPETAGWEHPTRLFRLTVVSGPDSWMNSSDGGTALISVLTGLAAVWYFIIRRPQSVGRHSEQSNTRSGG